VALDVLDRIDAEEAYANLALPRALERSGLDDRDRRFVTDLVYGTTRMRRACDFLVDRFMARPPAGRTRNALRLGAYQIVFAKVPVHAAVAETVAVSPQSAKGLVNAVLRRVAEHGTPEWPDHATRLSVPDWILDRLSDDLGRDRALAALAAMDEGATATERPDGYVQDLASQQVAAAVGTRAGDLVLDMCAAPGGKATAIAGAVDARVVAVDVRERRAGLVRGNAERLGLTHRIDAVVADGRRAPFRSGGFDRVLVDAPCSGLGTMRRRPDLRWRAEPGSVAQLARVQRRLLKAAAQLVRPGGTLVYSVCTLTRAESTGVDDWLAANHGDLTPIPPDGGGEAGDDSLPPLEEGWEPWGRGAVLLPQTHGTDGMCLFRYVRSDPPSPDPPSPDPASPDPD
jgi:16S rRNA (cytosine967-C5)-methyltransferase